MEKKYSFQTTEAKIYQQWEKAGLFNPDHLPGERTEAYTIVLPPPNITGALHIGHALDAAVQDVLIRQQRMAGKRALWIPGVDHAGIATQNVIEKQLKKEGLNRFDLGKEKLLRRIWEWKEKNEKIIINQLKKLGLSCDWSRFRFTMDPDYLKAVQEAFRHYQEKGWIYQAERPVNWCPRCQTTLSDLELKYEEEKKKLWFIKYPLQGKPGKFIIIATTRPETMLGDLAVAVNPQDKKYQTLIQEQTTIIVPLVNRPVPLISDLAVEPEFGTGAVKVTPAHDLTDYQISLRHHLGLLPVIDKDEKMTGDIPSVYQGLSITEAREKIVEDLQKEGLLEKSEDYQHAVPHCYRCQTPVEIIPSQQWFLKMEEIAKIAKKPIEKGEIKFYPPHWKKVYLDWLNNIQDWCLSRQIWWGIKVPLENTEDVLDTWFSSALWPFAVLGWPEKTSDLDTFYPTNLLSTGVEIMNLWVTRMIFSSLELTGKIPFRQVYFHPTILNKDGKRMSKSLGTGIDPLEIIQEQGADVLRFSLLWQTTQNRQDIRFGREDLAMAEKFQTKIWNASRFILQEIEKENQPSVSLQEIRGELKIVQETEKLAREVDQSLKEFNFNEASYQLYHFFWHRFCDRYLEEAKEKIKQGNAEEKAQEIQVLLFVLLTFLKLLHPFMPFLTEEIYQRLPLQKKKPFLMIEEWPVKSKGE